MKHKSNMNEAEQQALNDMIKEYNPVDNTELIKELKHSVVLKSNINKLLRIMAEHKGNTNKIIELAKRDCEVLTVYYPKVFDAIKEGNYDLKILYEMLKVLQKIETGELTQHEASFEVGKYLKQQYIDDKIKLQQKVKEEHNLTDEEFSTIYKQSTASNNTSSSTTSTTCNDVSKMTWKEYKNSLKG